MLTYMSCLSIRRVCGAFLAKCIDNFRPSLWFLVPPPFSSTSPDKLLQPIPVVESSLGASRKFGLALNTWGVQDATTERILPSVPAFCPPSPAPCWRSPPKLALKMETQPCVGGPQMQRRHSLRSTTQLWEGSVKRVGGGMGTPRHWRNAPIGRILSKGAYLRGFAFYWLANRATKASPVTPPNKRANGWRYCCYPEEEYTKAKSIIRIALL